MIKLNKVCFSYDGEHPVLVDFCMEIPDGGAIAVMGASGSGKTTFIKLLCRLYDPTEGEILLNNVDIRKYDYKEYMSIFSVVFQDFKLLPKLTVYENVAFAMEVLGYDKKEIHKRVMEVLNLVGLKNKVRQFPDQLSGGEQQRVVIARAIVNKPKLLICDEPTGNLDPDTSMEIMKVLENINAMGTTIIMATHDRDIVDKMKKRVIMLDHGKLARDIEKGSYRNERV